MFQYVRTMQGSLLFLDLGLGATLNRFVSQLLAVDEMKRLNGAISFASLLFIGLGLMAGLIMTGIGFILPSLVTGGTVRLYRNGLLLMVSMGGALAMRFWGYAPRGILFGAQRYDIVNVIMVVAAILRAGMITALFLTVKSAGLVTIGLCFLGCAVVDTLLTWTFAKRQLPSLRLGLRTIERSMVKEVIGFSVWVTIMAVTTMLIINAPTFYVGRFYGPEEVAFMSLSLLVLSQVQQLSGGFAFALIPVAGKYAALKDQASLQQIMVRGTKFCAVICFPFGVLAVLFAKPLFEWFKDGFGWTWVLLAIMMLPILVRTTQRVPFSVLMGGGSVKWLALGQIFVVFAIGFLSWLFSEFFDMGLCGIALGSAIPIFLFGVIFQPIYACRQVGLKWLDYMRDSYTRVLLCTIPPAAVALILLKFAYPRGFVMICLETLACLTVFAALAWQFGLTAADRHQILRLFQREHKYVTEIRNPSVR